MVFVLAYFIYKCKKTNDKIKFYEKTFGVVFTEEVIEDMKDIPPESYNYNPSVFVPEYHSSNNDDTYNTDFSQILIDEESEESDDITE